MNTLGSLGSPRTERGAFRQTFSSGLTLEEDRTGGTAQLYKSLSPRPTYSALIPPAISPEKLLKNQQLQEDFDSKKKHLEELLETRF